GAEQHRACAGALECRQPSVAGTHAQVVGFGALKRTNPMEFECPIAKQAATDKVGDRLRRQGACHGRGQLPPGVPPAPEAVSRAIALGVRSRVVSAATTVLYWLLTSMTIE